MRKLLGLAVVAVLAGAPEAHADGWRFEFHSGPDYRTQPYPQRHWHRRGPPVRQTCWSELHPGPFGYAEVVRCRPIRHRGPPGWGPWPGYGWQGRW
ncbi:MAG: hypothetical protein AB1918_16180 [Pseudomonadota bacterium]